MIAKEQPVAVEDPAAVKVTVAGNWQVSHDGNVYGPGDAVRVPPDVAEAWERAGYITR